MILAAYCRGYVSIQTPFIRGSMAAIGLGYEQVKETFMFNILRCIIFDYFYICDVFLDQRNVTASD